MVDHKNVIVMLPTLSRSERIKYSKRKYMMTRTDVLKKSILRALRNEYEYYFNQFLKFKRYSSDYDSDVFKIYLDEYADYLKQFHSPQKLQEKYGDLRMLPFVLGLFINFWKVKRFHKTTEEKKLMNLFYEVLYRYSHTKFDEFIRTSASRFLFEQVLTMQFLETFLERHKTLRKSKSKYRACAENLITLLSEMHQSGPVSTTPSDSQSSQNSASPS